MLPTQLKSVLDVPRNLPLKFHQNMVSNSWYIADIELVWFGWVVWWGGWVGVLTIFSKSKLQDMLKVFLLENKGKTWIYRLVNPKNIKRNFVIFSKLLEFCYFFSSLSLDISLGVILKLWVQYTFLWVIDIFCIWKRIILRNESRKENEYSFSSTHF